jgi:cytochrome c oxidase subunit 2
VSSLYFQDANGPSIEAILSYSDLTLCLILPIAILVLLLLFSHSLSSPKVLYYREHQGLEFTWTLVPAVAMLILAVPSLRLLYHLDEVGLPSSTCKAIGHQWYWSYESTDLVTNSAYDRYISSASLRLLSADSSLSLRSSLVLRLLISSTDVLHSWAVPPLGLKVDAVPGRLNQLSTYLERPGLFYGQCSEICGANHSFIPVSVQVLSVPARVYL